MENVILVLHIFLCVLLILVVLIQSGKGAEVSASFGGSSQTVFGSSGGANFFTKLTGTIAALFMITSLTLTLLQNRGSVFKDEAPVESSAPANTDPAAPGGTATDTPAADSSAAPANTESEPKSE